MHLSFLSDKLKYLVQAIKEAVGNTLTMLHPLEGTIVDWQIVEVPLASLAEHYQLPISFRVERRFEVDPIKAGLGGLAFREQMVEPPYIKDYDSIDEDGPGEWAEQWDLSNWGLLAAFLQGQRVGGVVLAFDTEGLSLLAGRKDLALLWDIRVQTEYRRNGIGQALFSAACHWAQARGCRWLQAETQNINVSACRFYARQGCLLGSVAKFAYPLLPDEVQLVWYKDITLAA